MEILQKIGQKIEQARKKRGWTQGVLAEHLGKTRQAISIYERGTKAIPIPELKKLADLLEVPLEYFFLDSEVDTELQVLIKGLNSVYRQLAVHVLRQIISRQNNPPTHRFELDYDENRPLETEVSDETLISAYLKEQKVEGE